MRVERFELGLCFDTNPEGSVFRIGAFGVKGDVGRRDFKFCAHQLIHTLNELLGATEFDELDERFTAFPAMTIESIGLGAGTREVHEQANIVRLFVGTVDLPPSSDRVWVLETNLDDLPGEEVGELHVAFLRATQ